MNKQIKQLLENLFDDYDDVFQDDTDTLDSFIGKKLKEEEYLKSKKWIINNISLLNGNSKEKQDFINNIDECITVDYKYYLNLEFTKPVEFTKPIPDYVKINKIKGDVWFHSSVNLPEEIEGNITIESDETEFISPLPQKIEGLSIICYRLKSLQGIVFPKKLENLYICCRSLRSLKGIDNSCISIGRLILNYCDKLQNLNGLPDSVETLRIESINGISNLKGCPKQLKKLDIFRCNHLENLIGCPESVENIYLGLLENLSSLEGCPMQLDCLTIQKCTKLKSLKYISPLITGDFSVTLTPLVDLSNGPKEVGGNYCCRQNGLKHLNAQNTVMTGHNKRFSCDAIYNHMDMSRDTIVNILKKELPKMNKSIKVSL